MSEEVQAQPAFSRYTIILFFVAILAAALVLLAPIRQQSLLFESLLNAGHIWLFFFLALLVLGIVSPKTGYAFFLIGLSLLGFGIGMELIQPFVGRSANSDDMAKNIAGITAGILLYSSTGLTHQERKLKPLLIIGTCVILLSSFIEPVKQLATTYSLARMPVIADFESVFSPSRITALGGANFRVLKPDEDNNPFQSSALLVELKPAPYSGFRIVEPHVNWLETSTFQFEVYNPADVPSELALRIDDAHHNTEYSDRFNRMFTISPGINTLVIPINDILHMGQAPGIADRKMDLANIASVMFYVAKPASNTHFYFDNISVQ